MACLIATEHVRAHAYDYAAFGRLIVPTLWLWNCLIATEHAQSHAYDYAAFGRLIVPTMLLEIRSDACVRLRPTAVRTYAVVVEHP